MPEHEPTITTPPLDGMSPPPPDEPPDAKKAAAAKKPAGAAKKKAPPAAAGDQLPGAGKSRGRGRPSLKSRLTELVQALAGALTVGATMAGSDRLMYDAEVVAAQAARIAEQLDKLAQNNPAVKRALESLLSFSDSADLVTTCSVVLIPILANHGLLPIGAAVLVGAPEPPPRPVKPEPEPEQLDTEPERVTPDGVAEPEPDPAARIFAGLRRDVG